MNSSNLILTLFLTISLSAIGQKYNSPLEYMQAISVENEKIKNDTWDYTSTVAHGKSARKVEKKRTELLKTLQTAKANVTKLPAYEGDAAYRDTAKSYLSLSYQVINYDYAKIVDMEEISEQSFDAMEAYMKAQEMANDKLKNALERLNAEQKRFGASHNITITEANDELSKKMEIANGVFDYYSELYLIFFKSYKQEMYLLDAIQRNDVSGIEQNKNALKSDANAGLVKLKEVKPFHGDQSVVTCCKNLLSFYNTEVESDMDVITDFLLKNENYNKSKAAFEAKKESQRTKEDVDNYNKAVNEMNAALNGYNAKNKDLFNKRSKLITDWNNSVTAFLDKHTPKK